MRECVELNRDQIHKRHIITICIYICDFWRRLFIEFEGRERENVHFTKNSVDAVHEWKIVAFQVILS